MAGPASNAFAATGVAGRGVTFPRGEACARAAGKAMTAATRARLSFFVRPLMVGTLIGGSFAAESLPVALDVVEAVVATAGVELATAGVGCAARAVGGPCGEIVCPAGDGLASLLAAQPSAAAMNF